MQESSSFVGHYLQSIKRKFSLDKILALPKEVWIGWVSSAVEAYNMAIYSFVAPLLATYLFRESTEANALIFSYFLVFIGSCFLYPLGAFYYGFLGDKQGRQKTCVYSTLGLALATGMMGIFPVNSFEDNAWIWFLFLLCCQYFFSGGEYYGSIVFSLEHSEDEFIGRQHKGLMSALSCLFAVFGIALANGVATLSVGNEGWVRIGFLVGAVGGLISYLLKNFCKETPAFSALRETTDQEKGFSFLKIEWRKIICVTIVFAFFMVSYSYIFIFLPLVNSAGNFEQNFDTFKSLIAYGFFLMAAGWLADRVGIYRILFMGMMAFSLFILPLSYFCSNMLVIQLVLTVCACFVIGPIHSWMLQQFEPSQRCRGIFVCSAIATAIFLGSTVPICLMIYESFDSLAISSLYPLMVAVASLFCLYLLKILSPSTKRL